MERDGSIPEVPTGRIRSWQEGSVDRRGWHAVLKYGTSRGGSSEGWTPVALVAPPRGGVIDVQFLLDRSDERSDEMRVAVTREMVFIIEAQGPDLDVGWNRVLRHCGSMANIGYSDVRWDCFPPEVDRKFGDFRAALMDHPEFERLSFPVQMLHDKPNWKWGYGFGVYCFVRGNETVYVGRAVGNTLGERINAHLHRSDVLEWDEVLQDPEAHVEVFMLKPEWKREWAFLAAGLEMFLIDRLQPRINKLGCVGAATDQGFEPQC
jgi:hypothetical protein